MAGYKEGKGEGDKTQCFAGRLSVKRSGALGEWRTYCSWKL